jgi:hypothetical protein
MTKTSLREPRNSRVASTPSDLSLIDPVAVRCPKCDTDLGARLLVTLGSAWSAGKRPPAPEAYLACPSCRKAWVASLRLSSVPSAVEGRAA